jgi:hypothetical protein
MLKIASGLLLVAYIAFSVIVFNNAIHFAQETATKTSKLNLNSAFGIRRSLLDSKYIGNWKIIPDKATTDFRSNEGVARVFFTYESTTRKNLKTGKNFLYYYNWIHLYLYNPSYSNQGFIKITQPVRFKKIGNLKYSLHTLNLIPIQRENLRNKINYIRTYRNSIMAFTENAHYRGQVNFKDSIITSKGLNVTALKITPNVLEGSFVAKTDFLSFKFSVHFEEKPVYGQFRKLAWLCATVFMAGIIGSLAFIHKMKENPKLAEQTNPVTIFALMVPLFFTMQLIASANGFNSIEIVFLAIMGSIMIALQSIVILSVRRNLRTSQVQGNQEANTPPFFFIKHLLIDILIVYVLFRATRSLFWRPDVLILLTGFCLTPQIVHNISKGTGVEFTMYIPIFVGFPKYLLIFFFFTFDDNLLRFEPFPWTLLTSVIVYVISMAILHLQDHLNRTRANSDQTQEIQTIANPTQSVSRNTEAPNNPNVSFANSEDRPVLSDSDSSGNLCSLCFSDLDKSIELGDISDEKDASAITVTRCNHGFHKKCLEEWLVVNEVCPKCKEILKKTEIVLE